MNRIWILALLVIIFGCSAEKSKNIIFDIEKINIELIDSLDLDVDQHATFLKSKFSMAFVQDSVIGEGVGKLANVEHINSALDKNFVSSDSVSSLFVLKTLFANFSDEDLPKNQARVKSLVEQTNVSDYIRLFKSGRSRIRYSAFTGLITDLNSSKSISENELYYLLVIQYILFNHGY